MDMGQRFRSARLEAGLSQAELCRDLISRNMLSLIESGSAKPSLSTLQVLAERLKKPAGYFLGENAEDFSGRSEVDSAWKAYRAGNVQEAARILDGLQDGGSFQDIPVLKSLVLLDLSEKAISEKRYPYARELLLLARQEAGDLGDLKHRLLMLQSRLTGQAAEPIVRELDSLDEELLLRAEAALEKQDPDRAIRLLDAAEDQSAPGWALLRGRACLLQTHFRSAARWFHQAEQAYPRETAPYLEQCYRELEDFKQAYVYACRQR